jgi:protein-S-isoprenylcysteine O-methyltransferase Ste14
LKPEDLNVQIDQRLFIYLPPPVIALGLLGGAWLIHQVLPALEVLPSTPTGGLVWAASGIALALSAVTQFKSLQTTVLPFGTPKELVTLGAYLWTRNPMYLGMLTALIGAALIMGTLPFFLTPWLFFLILNRIHIPYEEAMLTQAFGQSYERYLKRVRRWI